MPRQRYQKISILDKERLRNAYFNGEDFLDIARILNINRTTAYSIVPAKCTSWQNNVLTYIPRSLNEEDIE